MASVLVLRALIVEVSPGPVKPKTIKFVFAATALEHTPLRSKSKD